MTGRQRIVLAVCILASSVAFLDGSIVNVALPAMQRDLGGGLFLQQWVVDAYALSLGALILIAGSLADSFGHKRILAYGLVGFLAMSLACAVAPSPGLLIAARGLQGVAGALLVPCSLALIISTFSGPLQGRAIGAWTAWTSVSFVVGPLLGGLFVTAGSWRLIFAVNVVPVAVTLWLLGRANVAERVRPQASVDVAGALLSSIGLGGPVFALIEEPRLGWASPLVALPLAAGFVLLVAFMLYEARAAHPMLPLGLFRHHNFSVGNAATAAVYASLSAAPFVLGLFLQQVGGYSALAAGLAMLPPTLLLLALSTRFGALAGVYGPRWFMAAGPALMSLACVLLLRVSAHVAYWTVVFPGVVLLGVGLSVTVAPLTAAILGDVEARRSGTASAVNNAVARVAGLLAIAAVGALVTARFSAALDAYAAARSPAVSGISASQMHTLKTHPMDMRAAKTLNHAAQQGVRLASEHALRSALAANAGLLLAGAAISAVGIRNKSSQAKAVAE